MKAAQALDWTLHHSMRAMPIGGCSALGALLAPLMGKRLNPTEDARAKALFRVLKPEWAQSEAALETSVDRLWANVGRTYAEFAVSHRILEAGRVEIDGRAGLDQALGAGRPVIAIFCHLGNWELSEMQLGFLAPGRVSVIVAPPKDPLRADIARKVRSRVPADLLPMSRHVWRHAVDRLRTPGRIFMLATDEVARGSVKGPSFGRQLDLSGNLGKAARLALMTKALVIPFHNERLPGARFISRYLPAMEFEGDPSDEEAIRAAALMMNDALEAPIRRLMDQWYMALFAKF